MNNMKMQDRIFFKQIIRPVVINITNVCNNLGTELNNGSRKIFSAADMWNIQKRKKSLLIR